MAEDSLPQTYQTPHRQGNTAVERAVPTFAMALPGLVGLAVLAVILIVAFRADWGREAAIFSIILGIALSVGASEILIAKAHLRPSTGLVWHWRWEGTLARSAVKLCGLAATVAIAALTFWAFPVYEYDMFRPVWGLLWLALPAMPILAALTVAYVVIIDANQSEPKDGLWLFGAIALGLEPMGRHWPFLKNWFLSLLVKVFFTPLMVSFLWQELGSLGDAVTNLSFSKEILFQLAWSAILVVDVSFGLAGYLFTLKLVDTHIRTAEPTLQGWLVAVVCYPPIWPMIWSSYLGYGRPMDWGGWLAGHELLYWIWGTAIITLMAIYGWATVCFGLRFSNLTYRGTVAWGPYAWSRHPAYLSKNTAWWLEAVPFVPFGDPIEALRASAMLFGVNVIYWLRARTEERHLMRYPEYREYAMVVERRGLVGRVKRRLGIAPDLRLTIDPERPGQGS